MGKLYMKGLSNMEIISKVIRIELDCDIFYDEISSDLTEWWTDYDDLLDRPFTYDFLRKYYTEELKALKNKEIDYIALSCDL